MSYSHARVTIRNVKQIFSKKNQYFAQILSDMKLMKVNLDKQERIES